VLALAKRCFPFFPIECPVDAAIVGIVDHWHTPEA
jgi:hypothetical protein